MEFREIAATICVLKGGNVVVTEKRSWRHYDIQFFQAVALERGGTCLAETYDGLKKELSFTCAKGHDFSIKPLYVVHKGHWCPDCGGQFYDEHNLKTFQVLAQNKGGQCLSSEYQGITKYLEFKCANGHIWKARGGNILHRQSWCPHCARESTWGSKGKRLEQIQQIANDRLGKCLSSEYLGDKVNLLFECADGHQWSASPNTIKRPHWCPMCKKGKSKAA